MEKPRIAIVGLGSIGMRHAANLIAMGHDHIVGVEPRPMPDEGRFPVLDSMVDLGDWPTHAIVCTPPIAHFIVACSFVGRRIATFVEKPLTANSLEANTLVDIAAKTGTVLAVGYMERAHPVVKMAKAWAEKHKPEVSEFYCYWRATEKTYPLDVMVESSHAIDTAMFVMGKYTGTRKCGISKVRADVELKHGQNRSKVIMDMDAIGRRRITMYSRSATFSEQYGTMPHEWDRCYKEELEAFLNGTPLCTGREGLDVMEAMESLSCQRTSEVEA